VEINTDVRAVDSCETKLWNGGERDGGGGFRYHSRSYTYVINHASEYYK
jgi:hypothetical protein